VTSQKLSNLNGYSGCDRTAVIASRVAMHEPPKAIECFPPVVIGMNAGPDKVFPADTTCPFSKNPP
jgi:hypothetical protein